MKVVINKTPKTILMMLPVKYAESMLNITLFLNQDWNGNPTPSKTAKNNTLLFQPLPFIFLMELLTNTRNNPKPEPTAKKISKYIFTSSFIMNAFVIIPTAIKSVITIIIFVFFKGITFRFLNANQHSVVWYTFSLSG